MGLSFNIFILQEIMKIFGIMLIALLTHYDRDEIPDKLMAQGEYRKYFWLLSKKAITQK